MAQWQHASLGRSVAAIQTVQAGIAAYSAVVATELATKVATLSALATQLIPAAALLPNLAAQTVVQTAASFLTDFLSTGLYEVIVFPHAIDYNAAALEEKIEAQEAKLAFLKSLPIVHDAPADPASFEVRSKQEELTSLQRQRNEVLGELSLLGARNGAEVTATGDIRSGTLIPKDEARRRELRYDVGKLQNEAEEVGSALATLEAAEALRPRQDRPYITPHDIERESTVLEGLLRDRYFTKTDRPFVFPTSAVLDVLEDSVYDIGDAKRPTFGPTSLVTAGVVIAGADRLEDLLATVRTIAAIFRQKKLARQVDYLANLAALVAAGKPVTTRRGSHAPPDWNSASLATALGLEGAVDEIRARVAQLAPSPSPALTAAIAFASDIAGAARTAVDAGVAVAAALSALAGADVAVDLLYIPPVDGNRVISVGGDNVTIPNGTYGVNGFIRALREATDPPEHQYSMALVLLAGAPTPGLAGLLGANLADVEALIASNPSAAQVVLLKEAIEAAAASLAAPSTQLRTIFGGGA